MDIHRCRFVNYAPSAINALAFSYPSGKAQRQQPLRLAVGRANGDIEIWNPSQSRWLHEVTCKGGRNRSVEGLAWTQDPNEEDADGRVIYGRLRLFSIGYSSFVTEWDLNTGIPLQHSVGTHPEIWCLAAQPLERNKQKVPAHAEDEQDEQCLVAGCADGSIVLFSTKDGSLDMKKIVARNTTKNGRVLSITFQDHNTIVAGFADGFVRVYDIRTGKQLRAMSLGAGPVASRKNTLIWTVLCLKDGTVVAGDSTGSITFWDGRNYAQLQKVSDSDADILCMAVSTDSNLLFTGGMDRRLYAYTREDMGLRQRWTRSDISTVHEHDIKALTTFENKAMSVLVSGGLDISPVVTPMREFGQEYRRRLPHTPQRPPVTSNGRFVASWWDNNISIWRVEPRTLLTLQDSNAGHEPNYRQVAQLSLSDEEGITSVRFSKSGRLLAVTTIRSTKFFRLIQRGSGPSRRVVIKRLEQPNAAHASGAQLLEFSPDGKWLLSVTTDNQLKISRAHRDGTDSATPFLASSFKLGRPKRKLDKQTSLDGAWGRYSSRINQIAFSNDSKIIAATDLAGNIDSWIVEGEEDITEPEPEGAYSSEEDSDSDSEIEDISNGNQPLKRAPTMYGQRWVPNSRSAMLPKISHTAIVLSFMPSPPSSFNAEAHTNGINGINGRNESHNPDTSLDLYAEDRLLIVTGAHEILQFSLLQGTFTPWSQRNPPKNLPEEFKLLLDRTTGCLWDVKHPSHPRLWLYSAQWLCMFDLGQDLPAQERTLRGDGNSLVRLQDSASRHAQILQKRALHRGTTGAGSRRPDYELGTGIGARKIRKLNGRGGVEIIPVNEEQIGSKQQVEEEEEEDEDPLELSEDELDEQKQEVSNGIATSGQDQTSGPQAFYVSTKYRPILGIVPLTADAENYNSLSLSGADVNGGETRPGINALEVALIERPFWDLDLPPRFDGAHDQDKS